MQGWGWGSGGLVHRQREPEHCTAKRGKAVARSFPSEVRVSLTQGRPLEVNTRQHLSPFHPFRNPLYCQFCPTFRFQKNKRSSGVGTPGAFWEMESQAKGFWEPQFLLFTLRTRISVSHHSFCCSAVWEKRRVHLCTAGFPLSALQAPCPVGWNVTDGLECSFNYTC